MDLTVRVGSAHVQLDYLTQPSPTPSIPGIPEDPKDREIKRLKEIIAYQQDEIQALQRVIIDLHDPSGVAATLPQRVRNFYPEAKDVG